MAECAACGDSNSLSYTCSRCSSTFCPEHRLPESHDCPSISFSKASKRWFENRDSKPVGCRESSSDGTPGETVWHCQKCGSQYTTNQRDCVRCGETVFVPERVTESEYENLRPSSARRRRRREKKRRREGRRAKSKRSEGKSKRGTSSDDRPQQVGLWRFQSALLPAILSLFGLASNCLISSLDSEVFVEGDDEDQNADIYRIRPSNSDDGKTYRIDMYTREQADDERLHLKKSGTRVYTENEISTRLPSRITRVSDSVWWPDERILETGSDG